MAGKRKSITPTPPTFREYRVYLGVPERKEDAQDIPNIIEAFEKAVVEEYGGFTYYSAVGSWGGEYEKSITYSIITEKSSTRLFSLLKLLQEELKQRAILVTGHPVAVLWLGNSKAKV